MKPFLVLITASLSLFLSACWNKDFDEPGRIEIEPKPTVINVPADYARTWAAVRMVTSRFTLVKKDEERATSRAYLMTDWTRGKSDILFSGFGRNRIPYTIRYKLYIYVQGAGGSTQVSIKNEEEYLDDVITAGVDLQGAVHTWIKTDSSTLKENSLLKEIERLALDPKFKGDIAP